MKPIKSLTREQKHAFLGGLLMTLLWTLLLFAEGCLSVTVTEPPEQPPCIQRYWPPFESTQPDGTHVTYMVPMEPICPR